METMVVLTLMAILISLAVPSFERAIETAKADIAVANLRAVYAAERYYWVQNRAYSTSLAELAGYDLIDGSLVPGAPTATANPAYSYFVAQADDAGFEVRAERVGSNAWSGWYSIDQTGTVSLTVLSGAPNAVPPAASVQ